MNTQNKMRNSKVAKMRERNENDVKQKNLV